MGNLREIPSDYDAFTAVITNRQQDFFSKLDVRYGISRKTISIDTGIPLPTLKDWALGKTKMPLASFILIMRIRAFPNELASELIAASGKSIFDSEPGPIDIDDAAVAAADYLAKWSRARHPDSSSGIKIDHTERPDLELLATGVVEKIGKVAA